MSQSQETHPQRARFSHGWSILASSFAILFFNSGARYSFGVMFKPMGAEFGWNRGDISLAFFVNMILFALSVMVVGRFYDRYGPKWVIVISTLFLSAGHILISRTGSLWEFHKLYGFSNIGLVSGFIITIYNLGGGLWTYLGGAVFDRTGNYQSIFLFSTAMAFMAFLFTFLIQEKRHLRQGKI